MAETRPDHDIIIVGAGISGVNAAYRIQTQLPAGTTYKILEARDNLGGTWDLFKYPGVRSDSDLHTFGFPFRPWTKSNAIADGPSIVEYIKDTAAEYGIDQHILYRHKLSSANWSSDSQTWSLDVDGDGTQKRLNSSFLIMATGYYDYNEPLQTTIPGLDGFKGTIVHPQFWPEDLDYSNKKMVIIGSGATAITLLPNLAKKASHVVMLQRSPSYVVALSSVNHLDHAIRSLLPSWIANTLIRWRFLVTAYLVFHFCRAFPNVARNLLRKGTVSQLPKNVPHDPHFEPAYNPWEQRLCICPDGDFYTALQEGKASIATGHIKTVNDRSIELQDGSRIDDIDTIVTATGLKIQLAGGAELRVDGERIEPGKKFLWKGLMMQDVPNAAFVIGYTNASWTLGSDATAQLVTRLIGHMRAKGITSAVPRIESPEDLKPMPVLDLSSTYIHKAEGVLPKAGDKGPWVARKSYFTDIWNAKFGDIKTGLQFCRVST
ncbi:flavin-containing monooxygenase-like protein [Diplodia corticola]|uniref:Flavin-containing monooxygenase-like protein n=1 Tax=Diplodia corticola TaxID=236234 RepID=A0A1J9QVH7_9PEZI|nr:flavin-containing monooxygenase-like protein [Diplodia corticola]OJD32990.1 flavin-containing monooxygenase-like protein [Diplodia corticola]